MSTRSFSHAFLIVAIVPCIASAARREDDGLHIRVGAYNVSFLSEATAVEIGKMLKAYDLDIVGLTEVPRAPASRDLAAAIGADYFVVGTISSGESEDKLKTIVCRTPLSPMSEIDLFARGGFVSGGESGTQAETTVEGVRISIYCLHISEMPESIDKLIRHERFTLDAADVLLAIGDFNARLADPQMKIFQQEGFRPTWADLKLNVEKCKTYDLIPGRGPNGQDRDEGVIDHITYRGKGVTAIDGGIVPAKTDDARPMSDHAMIWAELVIPQPAAN